MFLKGISLFLRVCNWASAIDAKDTHFRLYRLSWPVFILIRIQYDKTAKLPKQPRDIQVNTRKHPVTHFVQEDNKTESIKRSYQEKQRLFKKGGKIMASLSITTSIPPPWLTSKSTHHSRRIPSASLILRTGRSSVSVNVTGNNSSSSRSGLLHCSFVSSSLCSSAFHSAFSG